MHGRKSDAHSETLRRASDGDSIGLCTILQRRRGRRGTTVPNRRTQDEESGIAYWVGLGSGRAGIADDGKVGQGVGYESEEHHAQYLSTGEVRGRYGQTRHV